MNKDLTTYEKYFFEFFKLTQISFSSVDDFFNKVKNIVNIQNQNMKKRNHVGKATIVLGYSGNGKSTYIKNNKSPNSYVISMDQVVRELHKEQKAIPSEMIKRFGEKLDNASKSQKKDLYIDGLWLNLLTRMSLVQTLKELGYDVTLVSLLNKDFVDTCLKSRIADETKNLKKDSNEYKSKKEFIINFHNDEHNRNVVTEQEQHRMFEFGVNKYVDTPNKNNLEL